MERNWSETELILVNNLITLGRSESDIYNILLDVLRNNREKNVIFNREYSIRNLHSMNVFEILYEIDLYSNIYNCFSIETILKCYIIDTLSMYMASLPNSESPYIILIESYISFTGLDDIDLEHYNLNIWEFYMLLENLGINIIRLLTNEISRLHLIRLSRLDCKHNKNRNLNCLNYIKYKI